MRLLLIGIIMIGAMWCASAASESTGTVGVCVTVLPELSSRAWLDLVVSGENWSFTSDTTASLTPVLSIHEKLVWMYRLQGTDLTADAEANLFPWEFQSASFRADTTLFRTALVEQTTSVTLSLGASGGVQIGTVAAPFAALNGAIRLAHKDHFLVSHTWMSILDPDLTSTLRAFISLGSMRISSDRLEDDATISSSLRAQQDLVPYGFSHATIESIASFGSLSSQARASYYGGISYQIHAHANVDWKNGRGDIAWTYRSPGGRASARSHVRVGIRDVVEPVEVRFSASYSTRLGWSQRTLTGGLVVNHGGASLSVDASHTMASDQDEALLSLSADVTVSYLWAPVVFSLWLSYSAGTDYPFAAGICASTSW